MIRRIFGLVLLATLSAWPGLPPARAQPRGERVESLPPIGSVLSEPVATLEQQVAQLAQRRADAPASQLPYLEFQVDVRVLAIWLCEQAIAARPDSELQVVLYLRARDALALVPEIDRWVATNVTNPLTRTQNESMLRLRQATYRLGKVDNVASLDALLRSLAEHVAGSMSPVPLAARLPVMRPTPRAATRPATQPDPGIAAASLTLPQIAEKVRQMSISPLLRQQVLALVQAVQNAADDPAESSALRVALDTAIELASGLQTNLGVDPENRLRLEQRLADALALYADPRTRSAGDRRLKALGEYRRLLSRLGSLNLPRELLASMAPAINFARENPERGNAVLDAIEAFARESARFDARRVESPLPDNYRRGFEDLQRQFMQRRQAFPSVAAGIGGRSVFQESVEGLDAIVREMRRINEVLDAIVQMPATLDRLAAYRVRPAGALERRVVTAIVQSAATDATDSRREASDFLVQLGRLQTVAQRLANALAAAPAGSARSWFGGRVADIETRVREQVTAIASNAAEGNPLQRDAIARLERGIELIESIGSAARVETMLEQADALQRWADWRASPSALRSLLVPLQQASSSAVSAWLDGDLQAIDRFQRRRQRFTPLLRLIEQSTAYADDCARLPGDLPGLLARLATPSHQQPFSAQRLASMGIDLVVERGRGDPAATEAALSALSQRLLRELRD